LSVGQYLTFENRPVDAFGSTEKIKTSKKRKGDAVFDFPFVSAKTTRGALFPGKQQTITPKKED
jgi:hypothetical protein